MPVSSEALTLTLSGFMSGYYFSGAWVFTPAVAEAPSPLIAKQWNHAWDTGRIVGKSVVTGSAASFAYLAYGEPVKHGNPPFHLLSLAAIVIGAIVPFTIISLYPFNEAINKRLGEIDVTLASANISDFPLLDPNYFGTEVDRYVLREASRLQYAFAGGNTTVLGRDILTGEIPPDGSPALSSVITDEELDTRIRATLRTAYHPHGTAAMGKVVDTNLKVIEVDNLYVVDTSVFPVAISAHLQVATYALAEQAAEILAGST